jgi:uncharacterized protein (DUF2235 family)
MTILDEPAVFTAFGATGASMSKNIILLSDGTGNSSSKLFKTNVWRLFEALDLRDANAQVAFYDDGVGTSSFKWWAAFTGIFGIGLKRNVLDIYCFCCRNHKRDDRIFGFGFSRGSFTIRVVAGLIASIGLAPYDYDEDALRAKAIVAYREYRRRGTAKTAARFHLDILRAIRDFFSRRLMGKPRFDDIRFADVGKIHFLGLWDTVDAYGGPIDEIVRAIDYWYWPLSFPDRFMNGKIQRACHALSLEDERDAFKPVLWDERYVKTTDGLVPVDRNWAPPATAGADIDKERISQVWFVGVHADVGGGYPQDGLAHFTLGWMIERARAYELKLFEERTDLLAPLANRFDKLNDSRRGVASYYRYKPRKLADIYTLPPYKLSIRQDWRHIKQLFNEEPDPEQEVRHDLADGVSLLKRPDPKIHDAAFERVDACTDGYAPIVIPELYQVTDADGAIRPNARETLAQAGWRDHRQEQVWDLVWKRRVTYFATMFGLFCLACLPIVQHYCPGLGAGSPFAFLIPVVDAAAAFLPNLVKPWFDAFREAPERLFAGGLFVGLLIWYGSGLQGKIRDEMRVIWKTKTTEATAYPQSGIYKLRTAGPYKAYYYLLTHWILPSIFALIILAMLLAAAYCALSVVNRLSFLARDMSGYVCVPSSAVTDVTAQTPPQPFLTGTLCTATKLTVKKGRTYDVSIVVTDGWEDGHTWNEPDANKAKGIETDPNGFGWDKMTWPMTLGLPIRRLLASNWFATIIQIGDGGFGEMVLDFKRADPPPCQCPAPPPRYTASFKAAKDGEVFVYVNDSIGWLDPAQFYHNNKGSAELTVTLRP